mmetsp:Transcript_79066/g.109822  ORF Transcript_79066/g.109822 Transcript_79066/m.109822 type:complete len:205 (-) Transcript_79066:711-1325(-)
MFPERETAFQQRPGLVKKERGSDPVWPKPLQVGRNRSLVPSPPQSDRAGVDLNPHGGYLTVQRTVCDRKSKLCTQWTPRRLMAARGKEAFRCCVRVVQIKVFHLKESLRLLMRMLGHGKAQALVLSVEHGVVLLQERNTQHEERAIGRRNVQGHQRQVARLIVGVMLRRERQQLRLAATAMLLDCKSELRKLRPLFAVLDAQLV